MATTRIMPLHIGKGRTESRAISDIIDYVANPQKTDNGKLITGYGCDSRTADAEFLLAKRQYIAATGRVRGADDVIAYHVRQSFKPGEITPEEANRLGVEFAKRFTKGNHAFVVCTHIDKSHVHNHIIWSAVNADCDRKFRNFWGSTKAIRRLSDTICIENGLSIVENVMEGIMSKLGLSGRAFIPMILGFGCTVPAIMASRSLENRRDRFKVMLITPFMSCSARLPIYILFAEMFFQERAMLVAYSMYLIGLVVAILVAAIIHLIDRRKSENYLLIELPEYKAPSARTVAIYVWEKVKDYLTKAGTTIFVASILMWVILNFGPHGYTTEMADSFGSILGHWLVPIFAPIGLGFWQIAVALIAGISAKEVVVSSCAVLFGIPNINSGAGMDTLVGILGAAGFGQLNAFCLMIFCLLYVPCAAALATICKESGSTRWMLFSALFQLVVAWAVTFVVYRVGLLL